MLTEISSGHLPSLALPREIVLMRSFAQGDAQSTADPKPSEWVGFGNRNARNARSRESGTASIVAEQSVGARLCMDGQRDVGFGDFFIEAVEDLRRIADATTAKLLMCYWLPEILLEQADTVELLFDDLVL